MQKKYTMHAREKLHLPICAYVIGDLELMKKNFFAKIEDSDAAGPEKQGIYLSWPYSAKGGLLWDGLTPEIILRLECFVLCTCNSSQTNQGLLLEL